MKVGYRVTFWRRLQLTFYRKVGIIFGDLIIIIVYIYNFNRHVIIGYRIAKFKITTCLYELANYPDFFLFHNLFFKVWNSANSLLCAPILGASSESHPSDWEKGNEHEGADSSWWKTCCNVELLGNWRVLHQPPVPVENQLLHVIYYDTRSLPGNLQSVEGWFPHMSKVSWKMVEDCKTFTWSLAIACVQTFPLPQEKSGEETSVNHRR